MLVWLFLFLHRKKKEKNIFFPINLLCCRTTFTNLTVHVHLLLRFDDSMPWKHGKTSPLSLLLKTTKLIFLSHCSWRQNIAFFFCWYTGQFMNLELAQMKSLQFTLAKMQPQKRIHDQNIRLLKSRISIHVIAPKRKVTIIHMVFVD